MGIYYDDIKEGECSLGGRGIFIGWREMRRVRDEEGEIKGSISGLLDVFGKEMREIEVGNVKRVREDNLWN